MPFPDWRAGAKVTSATLALQQVNILQPTSTQTVTSSTAFVNDAALVFALSANATYVVEVCAIFLTASTAPDVKTDWTVPAGATGTKMGVGSTAVAASFTSGADTRASFTANPFTTPNVYQLGTVAQYLWETAVVITAGTAGNVQFRWAQNTSNASGVTRQTQSFMRVVRHA